MYNGKSIWENEVHGVCYMWYASILETEICTKETNYYGITNFTSLYGICLK